VVENLRAGARSGTSLTPIRASNFKEKREQHRSQSQKNMAAWAGLLVQIALGTSWQGSAGDLSSNRYNRPPRR